MTNYIRYDVKKQILNRQNKVLFIPETYFLSFRGEIRMYYLSVKGIFCIFADK